MLTYIMTASDVVVSVEYFFICGRLLKVNECFFILFVQNFVNVIETEIFSEYVI